MGRRSGTGRNGGLARSRLRWRDTRVLPLVLVVAAGPLPMSACRAPRSAGEPVGPAFRTRDVFVAAELHLEREERDRKDDAAEDESYEQSIYQESVGFSGDGYVYHPNLLDYSIGTVLGLIQSDFESTRRGDRSRSDRGSLVEYDATARLLKESVSPVTVFARRHQSLVPRPFLSSEIQTIEEDGAIWQYVSEKTPVSVRYTKSFLEFDPLGDGGPTDIDERTRTKDTEQLQVAAQYNFEDEDFATFDYERRKVSERPFDLDYDIDDLRLAHHLRFGAEERDELVSEVDWYDQRGSVELEQVRLHERLALEHSDTLRSWYHLDVVDRSQRGITGNRVDDQTTTVGADLEHRLYESLISGIGGWLDHQEFDDGVEVDRRAVHGRLDYRKKNPWGVLTAHYLVEQQWTERAGENQIIEVIDLARTFNDPQPIVLNEPDILKETIVITDLSALVFFKLGVDYDVVEFAERVEIHRIPTGLIADGQAVLIDFEIEVQNDYSLDSLAQRFGVRQDFAMGLSPYYRFEWQDQEASGANAGSAIAEDITAHALGVEYRRGGFHAHAEVRDHDSSIAPYESLLLGADYAHVFESGASAGVNARFTDISYTGARPRDVTYTALGARYHHPLSRNLILQGSAQYLMDEDSVSGDDAGIDLDLSVHWTVRKTHLSVHFSTARFENDFTRSNATALFVRWELRF